MNALNSSDNSIGRLISGIVPGQFVCSYAHQSFILLFVSFVVAIVVSFVGSAVVGRCDAMNNSEPVDIIPILILRRTCTDVLSRLIQQSDGNRI